MENAHTQYYWRLARHSHTHTHTLRCNRSSRIVGAFDSMHNSMHRDEWHHASFDIDGKTIHSHHITWRFLARVCVWIRFDNAISMTIIMHSIIIICHHIWKFDIFLFKFDFVCCAIYSQRVLMHDAFGVVNCNFRFVLIQMKSKILTFNSENDNLFFRISIFCLECNANWLKMTLTRIQIQLVFRGKCDASHTHSKCETQISQ